MRSRIIVFRKFLFERETGDSTGRIGHRTIDDHFIMSKQRLFVNNVVCDGSRQRNDNTKVVTSTRIRFYPFSFTAHADSLLHTAKSQESLLHYLVLVLTSSRGTKVNLGFNIRYVGSHGAGCSHSPVNGFFQAWTICLCV